MTMRNEPADEEHAASHLEFCPICQGEMTDEDAPFCSPKCAADYVVVAAQEHEKEYGGVWERNTVECDYD